MHGNAMVYVLIIVALFGALSFVLARQTDTSESGVISEEKAEIYAGMILQSSMQLKQSVDQMLWTGSTINFVSGANTELSFTTPGDGAAYTNPPHAHKVFHPQGGNMILPRLPDDATNEVVSAPIPRWYIGSVNNIEWTPSTADDVVLTAYQLNQAVCERLNEKLIGSTNIPVIAVPAPERLIYGSASDFAAADCAACDEQPALCIEDSDGAYSFYSLIAIE